jgi:nuclear pore complex protein Nup155
MRIGTVGPRVGQSPPQSSQLVGPSFGVGSGPQRPPLTERAALLAISGRRWGMAVLPRRKNTVVVRSVQT